MLVLDSRTFQRVNGGRIEVALLPETCFVSQQVVDHGTSDKNITGHFSRQSGGEVGLGINEQDLYSGLMTKIVQCRPLLS